MGAIYRFDLNQLIIEYNLVNFFETGTLYGDGVDFALKHPFESTISIEIDEELYKKCQERFNGNNRVKLILGDTSKVIGDVLKSVKGNTLFWLDAHFPGADAGKITYRDVLKIDIDTRIPLEIELKEISKRQSEYKDVIICDDLWLYKNISVEGRTANEHCQRCGHNITREEIVEGRDLEFISDLFPNFDVKEVYRDQGYLLLFPK